MVLIPYGNWFIHKSLDYFCDLISGDVMSSVTYKNENPSRCNDITGYIENPSISSVDCYIEIILLTNMHGKNVCNKQSE